MVAASLSGVRDTVTHVALTAIGVSLAVVLALVAVGLRLIRIGLRPLADVEDAAERIAAGDLTARVGHADERGEVGRLARAFNRMVDQIEDAFRARQHSQDQQRTFLADASHELRTPLTSIRAYAELFRRGALQAPAGSGDALQRIELEAERMGRLVEDLLTLARLDSKPAAAEEHVDLGDLVRDLVAGVAATATDHHLAVETPPPDQDVTVLGDPTALRQVVGNLVANAVRHTPAGTSVRVGVLRDGDAVVTTVADDGPGMTAEVADRAFERFYRPEPGRSRSAGGTGLGLAIVRSSVEAHGGQVTLQTSPGHGARFTVRLPAAQARPTGLPPPGPTAAATAGGSAGASR